MALHLNLYHEIQKAELQRRRDPLKLGTYALALIALCFVAYYFVRLGQVSRITSQRDALKTEWEALDAQQNATKARTTELASTISLAENLVKQIETRFHWAPLLQQIAALVPAEVQITKLNGELRPNNICLVTVEGLSAGKEPRKTAEDTRTTFTTQLEKHYRKVTATFVSLEDYDKTVTLEGNTWPTASFTIRLEVEALPSEAGPAGGTPPTAATPAAATASPAPKEESPM
jgi:Tfp pilus assembly protein PilN